MLTRHGSVWRWVYDIGEWREQIKVFRLRCRPCRFTATLLPSFLLPGVRYLLAVVQDAVSTYLDGVGSYRAVAIRVTGVVLPADNSVSDVLTWTSLKPAFQHVHAWVKRVAARAVESVRDTAAWLTRRVPTSTLIDHLAIPLDPLFLTTRDTSKCADLDAARVLRCIFTHVPELNPHNRHWIGAWLRCMETIFGHAPWRGPPPIPAEPRGL